MARSTKTHSRTHGKSASPIHPFHNRMAATDLVPCFYTGQDYRWENPAEMHIRSQVREWKKAKRGTFADSGKIFVFFKRIEKVVLKVWDGPLGIGNLIPFAK